MEREDEVNTDSDTDSLSDMDDERALEQATQLESQVKTDPYNYSQHTELINQLKLLGDLERLRSARERMSEIFPLSENLWLDWIGDEMRVAVTPEERSIVYKLFERAVVDYASVAVWLEYVQFVIGDLAAENGVERMREVFERAVCAVGLHAAKGAIIWEAYRETENTLYNMMMAKVGEHGSASDKEQVDTQRKRIMQLFRRQLSCPHLDMENTYAELKAWSGLDKFDETIEHGYKKALSKLAKITSFENELLALSSAEDCLPVYEKYIAHEIEDGQPARIQCIYERTLTQHCLVPSLWQKYEKYLDEQLKISTVSLPVHERAIRNCPWSAELWENYLLALERYDQPHEKIKEIALRAVASGFSTADEYRAVWQAFLDYLRRRIDWNNMQEERIEELRATLNSACTHLAENYGLSGDSNCTILQYWAKIEGKYCKNMEVARKLWNDILSQGHNTSAQMWLQYINLEESSGDKKHIRKLYQRALTSAKDWPLAIGTAWLAFERCEGTLENFEFCRSKVEARTKQFELQQAKEAAQHEDVQTKKEEKFTHKKEKSKPFHEKKEPLKRKIPDDTSQPDKDGFKVPPAPAKKTKMESTQSDTFVKDSSKDTRTVFVSNLNFSVDEQVLRETFEKNGEIEHINLVKNFKGLSKGYGYVIYKNVKSVSEALKRDRELLESRPMFISKCDSDSQTRKKHFSFRTNLEKNKLFIKGLSPSVTKEDLETLFGPFGALHDVRLVTYRNGNSKGLAYVEYVDEAAAAQALLKLDGYELQGKTIAVALSNPPARKDSSSNVFSLGGGSKEVGLRGRSHTQLSFVPRSIQTSSKVGQNGSEGTTSAKKSNDDFRKLFLGPQ